MVCSTYVETITNVQNATEFMCWLHTRVDKKLISTENEEEIADTYMIKMMKLKYKYCNYKHKQKNEKYSGELCKTCKKKNHFKRNV